METDTAEEARVLDALTSLSKRIESLINGHRLGDMSVDALRKQTAELKTDIKAANKRGTIDGTKLPASELERMYYSKAIQDASSNFTLRADVSPDNPKWTAGLNNVKNEIEYHLQRLRKDCSV